MRHEVRLGHNIDEVRRDDRDGYRKPTTLILVEDIYVNAVIKDLQYALTELERIKR